MSLTPAQEMLNVKLNCDGFMTDSESEEEEGVSKLSKKSGALLDIQKKPGVVLAVEEQNEIDNEGATKEKGKSVENQLKETLKPATEAYFAFLDQSWRELATKSPQLTPKQIQDTVFEEWVEIHRGLANEGGKRKGRIGGKKTKKAKKKSLAVEHISKEANSRSEGSQIEALKISEGVPADNIKAAELGFSSGDIHEHERNISDNLEKNIVKVSRVQAGDDKEVEGVEVLGEEVKRDVEAAMHEGGGGGDNERATVEVGAAEKIAKFKDLFHKYFAAEVNNPDTAEMDDLKKFIEKEDKNLTSVDVERGLERMEEEGWIIFSEDTIFVIR